MKELGDELLNKVTGGKGNSVCNLREVDGKLKYYYLIKGHENEEFPSFYAANSEQEAISLIREHCNKNCFTLISIYYYDINMQKVYLQLI